MAERAGERRLELIEVGKRYGATAVLEDIDLAVEDGEFMTILGPSGSGKTTILRLIGGFIAPDAGRILFDGVDVAPVPIHRRPFNTVFQDYALFPHMTVGQNVGYGLMVRGVARAEIARRVAEALEVVALQGFGERYPSQLSGGQRQRTALARALICEPRLSCSTSRSARSMPSCAVRCRSSSKACSAASASPSCSSPTTRRRRSRCPTGSRS